MTAKPLLIQRLARFPKTDPSDELEFKAGVNVVAGAPNTGKTAWLRMLDFLWGDPDPPEKTFGEDLAEKYQAAEVRFTIGGQAHTVARRWKELGKRTKVFLDNEELDTETFQRRLLHLLEIPPLHFRKGGERGMQTWPFLSWRVLYRHIYRRQDSWTDLADKQPFTEQLAALLQFLGAGKFVFTDAQAKVVEGQRRILELQAQKEQFHEVLQQISRQLLDLSSASVALTPDGIQAAVAALKKKLEALATAKEERLRNLAEQASPPDVLEALGSQLATLQVRRSRLQIEAEKLRERMSEVLRHRAVLAGEHHRLGRVPVAIEVLSPLEVTVCPVCNQAVGSERREGTCRLCHRSLPTRDAEPSEAKRRIDYERERMALEQAEIDQLLGSLKERVEEAEGQRRAADDQIAQISLQLQQVRRPFASIIPPEISQIDVQIGQTQERVNQVGRVSEAIRTRDRLGEQITAVERELFQLREASLSEVAKADFNGPSDALADGINDYLNRVNEIQPKTWTHDAAQFRLEEDNFQAKVGKGRWGEKLGGTLKLYFLLGYNYGLLRLTGRPNYNYPGLTIVDLPPTIEGTKVRDHENFAIEPFVTLAERHPTPVQVLAFGNAFEGFKGGHKIELKTQWK